MQFFDGNSLYNAVMDAPIGICILDKHTLIAEIVNDKFLEVAGKPFESISGHYYWDSFPEARVYQEAALAGVVKTGEGYYADEVKLTLIRQGREKVIFVTFVYAPVRDEAGKFSKIAIWALENTKQVNERQKIEAERLSFELECDRLQRLFMQTPTGICILAGPDLVYEMLNPAYQQLLPGRKLLGMPIFQAVPELVGTPVEQALPEVFLTGETFQIDRLLIPLPEQEGGPIVKRYFSFSYQARRDKSNTIDGVMVFVSEVTGMIIAEQDLLLAKEQSDRQKRVQETITSSTPDLMYVFDLQYRFTYVNRALLSMWGKTWEDAVGNGLLENGYEPWHADMHEREIDQVVATRKTIRGEVSFPHAEYGRRIYDYIFTPVLDALGNVEAIAGTTRDITELKRSEELLAANAEHLQSLNEEMAAINEEFAASNEELSATNDALARVNYELVAAKQKIEEGEVALRLAIDAANFGTWFIHSVTREFITDKRLKELFGYFPDEELSIEQALAQITDEYRGYVSEKLEQAIYHNGDYDVTYPVIGLHDNRLRWLRAIGNLKADPSGAFSAFTGVVMDITEQYLFLRKIESAQEDLRMALDSGELAVWQLDEKLENITASSRFNEIFGFSAGDRIPFNTFLNRIDPPYLEQIVNAVAASFADGANFKIECPVNVLTDTRQRWIRLVGKFKKDEKLGNYITGVMADITEQKADEIRKSDFIGMVSHELKTPLTSLKGYVQVLHFKQKQEGNYLSAAVLEKAEKQISKMANMINGFLNVSRLDSGKISIEPQVFDIAGLMEEIREEFAATISSHVIVFDPIQSIRLEADRGKIEHVIHNLLSNAVKYSPAGSQVTVGCMLQDNKVKVSITDKGMGLSAADLPKIFDRYYRVKGNRMSTISGFGIGLYLCKEIIEIHGGEIHVDSELDKGSVFSFSIPLIRKGQ